MRTPIKKSNARCDVDLSHAHTYLNRSGKNKMNASIDIEGALSPQSISSIDSLTEDIHTRNESLVDDNQEEQQHPAHQEHLMKTRQYYRDMILGVNDGLVSTFLLVAGVVGGNMNVSSTLLTAISGSIAGAISMFAGEYVATKSQNEVLEGEIKLEHEHIKRYHAEEMQELARLLTLIGIPKSHEHLCDLDTSESEYNTKTRKLRKRITQYYASNPDALLKLMIALEFGVIDDEVRIPLAAGGTSFILFILGALPSALPFAFVDSTTTGLIISAVLCGVCLFVVGAIKTWATRGNCWCAAAENLLITAAGGGIAYSIGLGFDKLVGE